jgi:hypothetical protein
MRALLFVFAIILAGCPGSSAPSTECTRAGDRCQIREGLLGVCSESTECAAPPCLVCRSQH